MIVVGILLVALLVISDGATVRNEFVISDCNCDDNSEECMKHCANANFRSGKRDHERREIDCAIEVFPPNTFCESALSNASYCNNDQPFVRVPIDDCDEQHQLNDECRWKPCCYEARCPLAPDYTPVSGGSRKPENVSVSWSLYDGNIPKMLITWSQSSPVGGYQLFILTTNSSDFDKFVYYLDRCTCLNSSVRHYSTAVDRNYEKRPIQFKLISWTSDHNDFDSNTVTQVVTVPECWTLPGADVEKCSKMPTAPQNLIVTIAPLNDSSVILYINWERPTAYLPDIIIYRIRIFSDTQWEFLYTNESTLHCSAILNVSTSYEVMVDSSNSETSTMTNQYCSSVDDNCNVHAFPCGYYCWGYYADVIINNTIAATPTAATPTAATLTAATPTAATPTAIIDKASTSNQITLIAAFSGSGTLLLLLTIVGMLIVYRIYLHRKSRVYITLREVGSLTPSPVTSAKVFIINSPQSSDEDLQLVRKLYYNLADNAVEAISYDYCESGPSQSGIHEWMENNFVECDMILIVCNKSFYDAWNSNDSEQNVVVSASKQLLQGHLISGENVSKLAVVLLREHDRQYIPSLYPRNVTTFVVFSDGHCNEEDLVHYIIQVPRIIKPPVKDAAVTVASLTEETV